MIRIITLLKRRPGMSREDFVAYYESTHRLIGEKVLGGFVTHYVRHHLVPLDGSTVDHDFDVVMEMGFPDQAARDACMAHLSRPDIRAEIDADEEMLFDRPRMRVYAATAYPSDMPPVAGTG